MSIQASEALIVVPNEFFFEADHNQTVSGVFRIVPEDIGTNILIIDSSPFDIVYGQKQFSNLSVFFDNEFNMTIPAHFPAGNYTSYIYVVGENETERIRIDIGIRFDIDFSVDYAKYLNVSTNDIGSLLFTIYNNGNSKMVIAYAVFGDLNITAQAEDIISYPQIPITVTVPYSISDNIHPKEYEMFIIVAAPDNNDKTLNFTINVSDTVKPEIQEIKFLTEPRVLKKSILSVKATDNTGISSVMAFFGDKNITLERIEDLAREYRGEISFPDSGELPIEIRATDLYGNSESKNITVLVKPFTNMNFSFINLLQIEKDKTIFSPIFASEEKLPLKLTLTDYEFDSDNPFENVTGRINLFYRSREDQDDLIFNVTATVFDVERLELGLQSEVPGHYRATLKIELPNYTNPSEFEIPIDIRVGNATIPAQLETIVGGRRMLCNSVVQLSEADSYLECKIIYPLFTPLERLEICMTANDFDFINKTQQLRIDTITNRYDQASIGGAYATWSAMLLLLLITVYLVWNRGIEFEWGM